MIRFAVAVLCISLKGGEGMDAVYARLIMETEKNRLDNRQSSCCVQKENARRTRSVRT